MIEMSSNSGHTVLFTFHTRQVWETRSSWQQFAHIITVFLPRDCGTLLDYHMRGGERNWQGMMSDVAGQETKMIR